MGSQVEPQGGTLGPNGSQCSTPEVDPKHPGADYAQTANFILDVGRIWAHFAGFGIHSGAFGGPFWILLATFYVNLLHPRLQHFEAILKQRWNHFTGKLQNGRISK